jgi:hypothetical protein
MRCESVRVAADRRLFPPLAAAVAQEVLLDGVHHPPLAYDLPRSRWWLDGLRQAIPWLAPLSLSGVWRLLRRLDVVYKRGQEAVYSPDPDYDAKLAVIAAARQEAQQEPARVVFLYEDEMTYYRQPTVSQGYARRGSIGPRAWRQPGSNPSRRVAACLNAETGQLHTLSTGPLPYPRPAPLLHRGRRSLSRRRAHLYRPGQLAGPL